MLSGGRYDNLIKRFGKDCPATGFSLGINMVMTALERQNKLPEPPGGSCYIIYHRNARKKAFSVLSELRQKGETAELDIASMDMEKARVYAKSKGIKNIIVIDENSNVVTIGVS